MTKCIKSVLSLAAAALVGAQLLGCAHAQAADVRVPPAADQPWEPPPELVASSASPATPSAATSPNGTAPIALPDVFAALPDGKLSLPLAIDLALRNSPATRATWEAARAAAAEVGSQRSQLYPELNVTGTAQRQKGTVGGGQFAFEQTTLVPALDLAWLLLDFGGRRADVAEARESLVAANFTHNQ